MLIKYFINLGLFVGGRRNLLIILRLHLQVAKTSSWKMKTPIIPMPSYATHSDIWETFGAFFLSPDCSGVLERQASGNGHGCLWWGVCAMREVAFWKRLLGGGCAGEGKLKLVHFSTPIAMQIFASFSLCHKGQLIAKVTTTCIFLCSTNSHQ